MLLADLYTQLAPAFPLYAQKDLHTAVRVLAQALHCADPQHCPLEQYHRPLPQLYRLIEDYLRAQGKGPHTIRNTKNSVSRLFRLAAQEQLFSLPPTTLTRQYDPVHRPPRPGALHAHRHGTRLPYAQWSGDLQAAFTTFHTWATAPLVPGRPADLRKRMVTLHNYQQAFEGYFGYLHAIAHLTPTFDALFDLDLVTHYVHWHVNDCHQRATHAIHCFLVHLLALTRQYRPLPDLRAQLATLKKTIPVPPPVYNKADAWVSLATLEAVARALWPRKKPTDFAADRTARHPGLKHAGYAGLSLMLRLWIYIPYRQRNMREMQLGEHLSRDAQGTWRLTFRGEQLKIALKKGRPNVFDLPFPATLVPVLEDYLTTWRPILCAVSARPENHVFLTQHGQPYRLNPLGATVKNIVYRYTGKAWHPHLIRTVWATEWIRKTHGDFYTVAFMLNDKLETVIANYAHLLEEDVAEKAYRLIDERHGAAT
ncbi:MAG TPA: hypothetical protein VI542_29955 [Candidatus Tectomicrobia bacterium]